jgi:hypothetical protein
MIESPFVDEQMTIMTIELNREGKRHTARVVDGTGVNRLDGHFELFVE